MILFRYLLVINNLATSMGLINSFEGNIDIPKPCNEEVEKYLISWTTLDNHVLQENSLDKLFIDVMPYNKIEDVLIKCSTLTDFYSANIFLFFQLLRRFIIYG